MLIHLDISIASSIRNGTLSHKEIKALDLLATSRSEGNHILIGELDTFETISEASMLSDSTKGIYNRIYQILPYKSLYMTSFTRRLDLATGSGTLTTHLSNGMKVITSPLENFHLLERVFKSRLLLENLEESPFYEKLAELFLLKCNIHDVRIKFEPILGGGGTTHIVYNHIQNQNFNLCLCIADSDKDCPESATKETATNIIQTDDHQKPLCEYFILQVREIENLLSIDLLLKLAKAAKNYRKKVRTLHEAQAILGDTFLNYFDYKKGLKFGAVEKLKAGLNTYSYWNNIRGELLKYGYRRTEKCGLCRRCKSIDKCNVDLLPSLGKNILAKTIEHVLNKASIAALSASHCQRVGQQWDDLGQIVASWCCGKDSMPFPL